MTPATARRLLALVLGLIVSGWVVPLRASEPRLRVEVDPGPIDREPFVARATLAREAVPRVWREVLDDRPRRIDLVERPPAAGALPAQVERLADGSVRLTLLLPKATAEAASGEARRIRSFEATLAPESLVDAQPEARLVRTPEALVMRDRGQVLFQYNTTPVGNAKYPLIPPRDAYIGPAYTRNAADPALITGDYSPFHPHHRGFFLAYAFTVIDGQKADFWNIQSRSGIIRHDRLEEVVSGPVSSRFSALHRWEVPGKGVVLRERWDVEVVPGVIDGGYQIDLTATQQAVGPPVRLEPYRYGGMAYRGPEPFVKGPLDVQTSEGAGRRERDQKPARWVDLTGPVAEGSDRYAGALILDHPQNPHHPTVARIHPTTLPFFCWVPAHDQPLTIGSEQPTVFRYRILVHEGRPDRDRNERLWHDFATPATARAWLESD